MSKRNGDRSRAHREQQKKLLRRKRTLELRQGLPSNPAEPVPAPGKAAPKSEHAE